MANKKAEILTMDGQVVSPITLATNVLLEDGRTAQDLLDSRDESMFTPMITTSSPISKVGQGDNVDFSENIIDGAYKSCVLKGKTLVNYNAEGNDRDEYVCMPSLEGNNLTVNGTVEGKVKSAILKGNTILVNEENNEEKIEYEPFALERGYFNLQTTNGVLTEITDDNFADSTSSWYTPVFNRCSAVMTFQSDAWNGFRIVYYDNEKKPIYVLRKNDNPSNVLTLSTPLNAIYFRISTFVDKTIRCVSNKDYLKLHSVRMPVLTTIGKNIVGNYKKIVYRSGRVQAGASLTTDGDFVYEGLDGNRPTLVYEVKPNENVVVSSSKSLYGLSFYEYGEEPTFAKEDEPTLVNEHSYTGTQLSVCRTMSANTKYVGISFYADSSRKSIDKMQVELGTQVSQYEPYKSNILTTPSDLELRGIGDVRDELDCLTGQVTERIGEIVLDGSEYWSRYLEYTDSISFISAQISDSIDKQHNANDLIVDKLIASGYGAWSKDYNITLNTKRFSVCVPKTVANDVATFKKWLSENNVTVQYPLATPTIKTVDLSDNMVYSYKDTTHYTCSSEEGSLLPTLTIEEGVKYKAIIKPSTKYSVVFNRTEVASGLTVDLGGATTSVTSSTLGKNIVQITTPSTLSHNYVIFKGLGNVIKDVQVIEGDVVGDEPYFEGMVDVKNPSVMNCNTVDTEDENYKSNTATTNEVVLRSLPNGVCDTLDLTTGEYIQRVGEIVFDGSEDWIVNGYTNNQSNVLSYFSFRPSNLNCILNQRNGGLSSKFHNIDCASFPNNEGWQIYNGQVRVNVLKSKLSEDSIVGFKQWLSQNPITVQYELATPITTTIDLKQHPYAYKDGYINLSSNSEKSLTPTIEYSLIANRLGQIQSNQKLVEKQQAQIDELESMIVTNLVNTQYQQALNEIKLGVK